MQNCSSMKKNTDERLSTMIARLAKNACETGTKQTTHSSIEIYPPRTEEAYKNLPYFLKQYCELGVLHINVIGKMNKNSETLELVRFIKSHLPNAVLIPHLVGYNLSKAACAKIVHQYVDMGITNIFAVRGDIAEGMASSADAPKMDFPHAFDLVHEVKRIDSTLCVGVAGYPSGHYEQPDFLQDIRNLKHKVDAGADYIITQLFFQNDEFSDFVDRCRLFDIHVPIIPGITCVKSKRHIDRISSLALGYVIPSQLLRSMYQAESDDACQKIGEEWLAYQVQNFVDSKELLVHFYVFNALAPFSNIIKKHTQH